MLSRENVTGFLDLIPYLSRDEQKSLIETCLHHMVENRRLTEVAASFPCLFEGAITVTDCGKCSTCQARAGLTKEKQIEAAAEARGDVQVHAVLDEISQHRLSPADKYWLQRRDRADEAAMDSEKRIGKVKEKEAK
ncbi:MAG: hypothetical protein Q8Q12_00630 [bacterium]|nr:hypothetical protein [bacterium]